MEAGGGARVGEPTDDDEQRWRALAREVGDLASLQRAGATMRGELRALDLESAMTALAAVAEDSHALARYLQADLEAVRVHEAAGVPVPAEAMSLCPPEASAVAAVQGADGRWRLSGSQRRSVHPGAVTSVVVVARTPDGDRPFTVAVDAPGVVRDLGPLRTIAPDDPNGPVTFTDVVADPVGDARWEEVRPTPEGLLLDAACWLGACRWLRRTVEDAFAGRSDPAETTLRGRADVAVSGGWAALAAAVPVVAPDPRTPAAELAARRAIGVVAVTADGVIRLVARVSDGRISREDALLPSRVAQLQIALRRFDGEGNLRAVGDLVAAGVRVEPTGFRAAG